MTQLKKSLRHKEFVSVQQREQAAAIINKLREYFKRAAIAQKIGIRTTYVTYAASMSKQMGDCGWHYLCPHKDVLAILAWGAAQ